MSRSEAEAGPTRAARRRQHHVVEGLGIQRALDPEGFDHARAWRAWVEVVGGHLGLSAG